jgi:hypothetical protein
MFDETYTLLVLDEDFDKDDEKMMINNLLNYFISYFKFNFSKNE